MAAQTEKLAAGQTRMVSSTMAATAALKEMEGGFPIRSAARFLSTIEGIGPALQAAFPVLGAIAMAGAINTIIDKVRDWARAHDPVVQAQKESLDILKRITREYESAKEKAHQLRLEQIEITGGPDARRRAESFELGQSASGQQQHNIERLQNLQRVLQRVTGSGFIANVPSVAIGGVPMPGIVGTALTEAEASALRAAGAEGGGDNPFKKVRTGDRLDQSQIDAARTLLTKGIIPELETARLVQRNTQTQAATDQMKADADERKKAEEKARKALEEFTRHVEAYTKRLQAVTLKEFLTAKGNLAGMAELPGTIAGFLDEGTSVMPNIMAGAGAGLPAPPPGYISPREQLRLARTSGSFMMRQARGGSPNDIYQARLEAAELIYQAELGNAKTEMDRLDAEASKRQAIFEAEMERLDKIEEMINRQKEEFERNLQGLVHAAALEASGVG
jgi:hypothetical protein